MTRHVAFSLGSWTLALSLASGCLLDERRCGPNQVETEGRHRDAVGTDGRKEAHLRGIDGCVCMPGFVPAADLEGCVACGENEVPLNGTCSCAPGYQRAAGSETCVPRQGDASVMLPSGEGRTCSTTGDCAGTDATFCQTLVEPHICLIQGCMDDPARCGGGRACCDFSQVPQWVSARGLCLLPSLCTSPGKVYSP